MAAGLPDELENGGEVSEKPNPTSTPLNNATVNNTVSIVNDKGTASSGFGSYADFQSQTELCPSTITKDKESYYAREEDSRVDPEKSGEKNGAKGKGGESKEYTGVKRYGGMILTVTASVFFSLVTLMVKMLSAYGADQYGSSFWRYLGITIPTIPIFAFYECGPGGKSRREKSIKETGSPGSLFDTVWPIFKDDNWKTCIGLFMRGLIGSSSVILRYYALQYLSIGDTSVITYSTPVLVTVMAHFFLGERCGVIPVIVSFTTLAGVVIVTKPPLLTGAESFDTDTLIGTALACGSLFCSALIVIITRKIREVHFALMICVFGIIGVAQAAIMAHTLGHGHLDVPTQLEDLLLTVGVATFSFFGQSAIVLALKFEQAGPVALLRSCDVIFGFILQFLVLHIVPDEWSSLGGIIVLTGVIIIASRKWIVTLDDDHCAKKCFGWVLY
ncbi:solute carrier family 35 member G1 isoform X2 [Folsomia candida]|uniref:solute carrier family 35 member G1 isoform X2 n=1 Tax=Folsomia candida TaxID=158441 RepID=UPI000B902FEF|nr:solute carrier family 35 member G1 isoform X2 [Folsomia candida]